MATSRPPSLTNNRPSRCYIQLGRTGDAIASVPLCWLYWKETGKKCALMVHRQFASFLEGITYIHPEIWDGDWKDIPSARARARMLGYKEVITAQIYGHGIKVGRTQSSFILESWHQVGRIKDFGAPLVFDNRNYEREADLAATMPLDKPVILVAADGISSPFTQREDLMALLRDNFAGKANVVDLADYKTSHFHDFLGMIDRAAVFVTIDTGFGQLAQASVTPVVALIANKPTTWHSSPRRPNHVAYIRYNEFNDSKLTITNAIENAISSHKPSVIHHVWAGIGMSKDSQRRHNTARETWVREAKAVGPLRWKDARFTEKQMRRSAKDFGDVAALPYIHDMLDAASTGASDHDVLLLTNADICLIPGMGNELAERCSKQGAVYCYRWDFPLVVTHIDRSQISRGKWYVGCDLFAMTVGWWKLNRSKLPPFVIGRECWDWVFRKLIEETGGSELHKGIYHEKHSSPWENNRTLAGNLHNRSHARAWLESRKIDLAEIRDLPYFPVTQ